LHKMDSIWDRIEACAANSPGRLALIEPGECAISYAQLWAMIETTATLLRESGVGSGDTVAVILPDGVCGFVSVLAVARVCSCAPINPAVTAAELETDLLELRASAVITSRQLEIPQAVAGTLGLAVIEAFPLEGSCAWRVLQPATKTVEHERESPRPMILLHTSATTGRRKLVPLSSENLHAMFENTAHALRLSHDDRLLMLARLFHTQGILSPCAQLLAGGSVIVTGGFAPQSFGLCIEVYRPTWYTCGPTLHRAILTYLEDNPLNPEGSLRFVRCGGARLSNELRAALESALHVPVLNVYGLTETGAVACTSLDSRNSDRDHLSSDIVGRSMGPDIAVMSAESAMLPVGTDGEVVVSGPTVMAGYLNDPAANRDAFFGKWFRTGDLGRLDQHGYLHITGRLKEMINRGGQKIVPEEVEAVLTRHEAVLEAVAFGVPHPTLGEDVACAVVFRKGRATGEKELREFAAKQLAFFKVPRRIYQLDSLPVGVTGKPRRAALKQRFSIEAAGQDPDLSPGTGEPTAPSLLEYVRESNRARGGMPNDLEPSMQHLWRKHTNSEDLRQDIDFFSSGGDSLSAVAMLIEVEALAGLKSPLYSATFFKEPTLATLMSMLSEAIAGRTDVSSSAIQVIPLTKERGRLPLFMIPSDGDEGYGFRQLSRALGDEWPLSLVRPENCWHERSVSSLEETGAEAATAILAAKPAGPCVVGGYCYGGVVAYETVRQLERQGESVILVLFDVPMPGHPHILLDWRIYLTAGAAALKASWQTRRLAPTISFTGRFARRLAWFSIRGLGPMKQKWWKLAPFRWLCSQARRKYFAFYRPGPIRAPLLHFCAEYERDIVPAMSRRGWESMASGATVHWLPCDHNSLLDKAHLKQIATAIQSWRAVGSAKEMCYEAGERVSMG
jgi:acyl-CoA synthetase (AMP-forming)/AMP-acid ligase II/thioesterase domain-containing protein